MTEGQERLLKVLSYYADRGMRCFSVGRTCYCAEIISDTRFKIYPVEIKSKTTSKTNESFIECFSVYNKRLKKTINTSSFYLFKTKEEAVEIMKSVVAILRFEKGLK